MVFQEQLETLLSMAILLKSRFLSKKKISSKFKNSALVSPEHNLRRKSKNELIEYYDTNFNNSHERDALAGAVYAYKKNIKILFRKSK